MKHRVIGIDLGTTYSAVAVWDSATDEAVIIPDESGRATTPSVVAYDPHSKRVMVGEVAKRNIPNAPDQTIIEIKREMGEKFNPETLAQLYAMRPDAKSRDHVKLEPGEPYHVWFAGDWRLPQEISAL